MYGRNSFRGGDLSYRDRHFIRLKDDYALRSAIRERVNFSRGNVVEDGFLAGVAPYDFIFFRNLLIYFDRPTQAKVLARIARLLGDDGFLFVGPAELPLVVNHGFVSAHLPMAFACRKAGARTVAPRATLPVRQAPRSRAPATMAAAPLPSPVRRDRAPSPLESARRLADAGRLREAAALCESHLHKHGASAHAYYLLGLVADAQGLATATEFYRKALYLDPNHYEALVHMSLLCAKQGDTARARVFSRRAERARLQEESR